MYPNDPYSYPSSSACPPGTQAYRIAPGDTLWALAQEYGTTVEAILAANPCVDPRFLQIGRRICIPAPAPCPTGSIPYIITAGDTFWSIAQGLGVPVRTLLDLNPGVDPMILRIGQRICVPAPPPLPVFFCVMPLLAIDPISRAGGSVWIREDEFSVTGYSVIFAAAFLPEPESLGNFTGYIGRIRIAQPKPEPPILHTVLLSRVVRPVHQVTWAGTRILPEGPAPTDNAEVRLYNETLDTTGPALLRNTFEACIP